MSDVRKETRDGKEVKIMTKTVDIKTSKKNTKFFAVKGKDDKMLFVNLVKDNKAYLPELPKWANRLDVDFTSYKQEDNRLVLFGVENHVFRL